MAKVQVVRISRFLLVPTETLDDQTELGGIELY